MPVATVDPEETHRFELKSLPEGFVVLRRMSYGEWLQRQEMLLKMKIESQGKSNTSGEMSMANKEVTALEFRNCIVDHNLTDSQGNNLDFRSPIAIATLNPKVGSEIGEYINGLHEFEVNEENFMLK